MNDTAWVIINLGHPTYGRLLNNNALIHRKTFMDSPLPHLN